MVKLLTVIVWLFFTALPVMGNMIITEALSNEPANYTSLEWIELFNNSSSPRNLIWYTLTVDQNTFNMYDYSVGSVGGYQYAVLCKNLVKFDSVWGNNSGVWSDDPVKETYPVYEIGNFALNNDSGRIVLYFGSESSIFRWTEPAADAVSWERKTLNDSLIGQCNFSAGATPGGLNSITPLNHDLMLLPVTVTPYEQGLSLIEYRIVNFGLFAVSGNQLSVYYDNDGDSVVSESDLIYEIDYESLVPGDTQTIMDMAEFDGLYPNIYAKLPDDQRNQNNVQIFRAFGVEYPPIIISEFLADPENGMETEWIELKNRSNSAVDINGWLVGDEQSFRIIIDSSYIIPSGEYIVLCQDSTAFYQYYSDPEIPVLELSSWSFLNNDIDIVRLKDNFNVVIDSCRYDYVYGGNFSWARSEAPENNLAWGRSTESGGSPGEINAVYLQATGTDIVITIDPNPFSPRLDNETTIEFMVPAGEHFLMRIYDLEGRLVKTMLDENIAFDGSVHWSGTDDDGRRLNVGMYVLYVEISGVASHKQTVVIAP